MTARGARDINERSGRTRSCSQPLHCLATGS